MYRLENTGGAAELAFNSAETVTVTARVAMPPYSEDLLLQSWFDGTGYWTVRECGFCHLPVRVFRWKAGY